MKTVIIKPYNYIFPTYLGTEGGTVTAPVLAKARINLRDASFEFEGPPEFVTQQLERYIAFVERLFANDRIRNVVAATEESLQDHVAGSAESPIQGKDIERHFGVNAEQLRQVIEFDDNGTVHIVAQIDGNTADTQRQLGLLYCLAKEFLHPDQPIPSKELRDLCKSYGCTQENLARNLKSSGWFIIGPKSSTYKLNARGKAEAKKLVATLAGGLL